MRPNIPLILLILVGFLGTNGCLPFSAPAPPPVQVDTIQTIIAATAGAAATQTAAFRPSPTPLPSPTPTATLTPTITPTPTPLIIFPTFTPFILPSPGGGGGGGGGGTTDFACVLLDQSLQTAPSCPPERTSTPSGPCEIAEQKPGTTAAWILSTCAGTGCIKPPVTICQKMSRRGRASS